LESVGVAASVRQTPPSSLNQSAHTLARPAHEESVEWQPPGPESGSGTSPRRPPEAARGTTPVRKTASRMIPAARRCESDSMTFTDLQLPPDLIAALTKQQISDPTPVQSAAIPVLLAGKDAYLKAETGTGKTLAYLL